MVAAQTRGAGSLRAEQVYLWLGALFNYVKKRHGGEAGRGPDKLHTADFLLYFIRAVEGW